MKDGKRNEKLSWLSKVLLFVAFLCIIFSLVAPMALSESNHFYNNLYGDFSNDTVGGLMNPFIAIAGVIVTFLAFSMQVRANKIQQEQFRQSLDVQTKANKIHQEQFKKTLAKPFIEEKKYCYNYLSMAYLDLNSIILFLRDTINGFDSYIKECEKNPFLSQKIIKIPLIHIENRLVYDKLTVYKSFCLFSSEKKSNNLYHNYLRVMDNVLPLLTNMYVFFDENTEKSTLELNHIGELLIKLDKQLVSIKKNSYFQNIKSIHHEIQTEIQNSMLERRSANIRLIESLIYKLDLIFSDKNFQKEEFIEVKTIVYNILTLLKNLRFKNEHIIKEYYHFLNETKKKDDSLLKELELLKVQINDLIKDTSEDEIEKDYLRSIDVNV